MGWNYYVYTILDILYCKDNLNSTCEYIVGKERKHFNSYDGDIDSDESEYDQAVNEYYEKQLTKPLSLVLILALLPDIPLRL